MKQAIARYFQLEKFKTTIGTEIIAGMSTYLSLAYIFIVNPSILAQAGMDPKSALFATVVSASLATLAMGVWANLPFAVAPGLTMNSYFVFVVCKKMHLSWQQGLAAVCVSGFLCVILTALPLRQTIIDSIPEGLKRAITLTIGVFVATIGLFLSKVIAFTPAGIMDFSLLDMAHIATPLGAVMLVGFSVAAILGLRLFHFPAGMLVAIMLSALLYHHLLPNAAPQIAADSGDILTSFAKMDFSVFLHSQFWLPVIVFFVLDFFEGIGEFIGMTSNTTIQDQDDNVPHMKQALWVDGFGTIGGSLLGTSSLIVFIESAVGIKAGGRTGLTAVVCGLLMIAGVWAGLHFSSVLTLVPAEAAAGILVYVGYLIVSGSTGHGEKGFSLDCAIAAVMAAISLTTFSLDKSLAFGFWAYFALSLQPGGQKPAWWLGGIAAAMTAAIACSV
jgi:AGZA family xanthine/uracil permease-like MFS transporter